MFSYAPNDQSRPVAYLGGHALYTPHVIALGYVVTLLLTTLCLFARIDAPLVWLPFDNGAVLRGQVWRLFTYGLVNAPSLWFVIDMALLVWFGRELEKFFGRRVFLRFYAGLYLLTPVLFTVLGLFGWPLGQTGQTGSFALFIAFTALYPSAIFFFNIQARWLAAILVGIYSLIHLSSRNLPGLVSLWAGVGYAYGMVRYEQGRLSFRIPNPFARTREPRLKVLPGQGPAPAPRRETPTDGDMADVDALLDKIAKSGIHSLTAEERARLDRSSAELMRRKGTPRR